MRNPKRHRSRSRQGVSAVIAEVILVAITLSIGVAFWSSAQTTAGTQLQTFVNRATSNINRMNENFVVVNLAFDYDHSVPATTSGMITIWFYNNGDLPTNVTQVQIQRISTQEVATFDKPKFILGATNCTTEEMDPSAFTCLVVDLADPSSGPTITITSGEIYKVTTTVTRGNTGTLQEVAP